MLLVQGPYFEDRWLISRFCFLLLMTKTVLTDTRRSFLNGKESYS